MNQASEPMKSNPVKHVSFRVKAERLRRLRQAALDRDWSLQRLLDEAIDHFLDSDRQQDGEPTEEAAFADRMRQWRREAGEQELQRLEMFLGWR